MINEKIQTVSQPSHLGGPVDVWPSFADMKQTMQLHTWTTQHRIFSAFSHNLLKTKNSLCVLSCVLLMWQLTLMKTSVLPQQLETVLCMWSVSILEFQGGLDRIAHLWWYSSKFTHLLQEDQKGKLMFCCHFSIRLHTRTWTSLTPSLFPLLHHHNNNNNKSIHHHHQQQ